MARIPELDRRPLPTLKQWLDQHGDGSRGEGFAPLEELLRRGLDQKLPDLTPDQASYMRLWLGLQIAVVELSNIEVQKGRAPLQIIQTLPRALAVAAMYATASVLDDEAPLRAIAKILIEDFRFGAKEAADQIMRRQDAAAAERSA